MVPLELTRHLGVNYKAAWRIKHKVMRAMAERVAPRRLSGFVQSTPTRPASATAASGVRLGEQTDLPDRGADGHTLDHPTYAVIEPVCRFDDDSVKAWQAYHLAPDVEVFSNGLFCFRRFADAGHAHAEPETAGRRAGCEVRGARWINIVLDNVKRAISGSYHAIRQGTYARRYLAEVAYCFNRRFRLREMVPRVVRATMLCKPHPESTLRLASNFHG